MHTQACRQLNTDSPMLALLQGGGGSILVSHNGTRLNGFAGHHGNGRLGCHYPTHHFSQVGAHWLAGLLTQLMYRQST